MKAMRALICAVCAVSVRHRVRYQNPYKSTLCGMCGINRTPLMRARAWRQCARSVQRANSARNAYRTYRTYRTPVARQALTYTRMAHTYAHIPHSFIFFKKKRMD